MEIVVGGEPDESVSRAVRLAVDATGLGAAQGTRRGDAWWRAGLRDALDRGSLEVARPRYEGTPPPRKTRGATRA